MAVVQASQSTPEGKKETEAVPLFFRPTRAVGGRIGGGAKWLREADRSNNSPRSLGALRARPGAPGEKRRVVRQTAAIYRASGAA